MKDLFSQQAKQYAAFRPHYPAVLYKFIFDHVKTFGTAWDCATGNGQVAQRLAERFEQVYATDISEKQLAEAVPAANIQYAVGSAENTSFQNHQFDLVTVAQALHWFDLDKFHAEVNRVGKPGAVLAVWSYALLYIAPDIDDRVTDFYSHTVGPYWDQGRRLVEEEYASLPFPFERIRTPRFVIEVEWSLEHLAGYFSSWSATQKFIKENGHDPVRPFIGELEKVWGSGSRKITFPVALRLGRIG